MPPSISLITTVYNRARTLPFTIESVLAQTHADFELLIWDDGSTDDSVAVARHYALKDDRIRVIAAEHQGIAPTLKSAIAATTGTYLGWVDSDDLLAPTALAETVAILNAHPDVGMVYTNYEVIDGHGQNHGLGQRCQIPYSKERLLVDFMTFHFRLMRRSVYDQVGGINAALAWAEDYDLCLKLSEVTDIYHLPKPLYYYRRHNGNITNHQLEAIRWAHTGITQALHRRGLDVYYDLDTKVVSHFRLVPKTAALPSPQPAKPQTLTPLVSIILPCHNAAARIQACLQSCQQQTYPNLEIIVVNNNATDQTPELVQQQAAQGDRPFQLLHCQPQGANHARNLGFTAASGAYIQWLDADDELHPDSIAAQVAALEAQPAADLAYSDWAWHFYQNQQLTAQFTFPSKPYDDFLLQLLLDNWRPPHAYLLRRTAAERLQQLNAWNPHTAICMDREYFTLAALLGLRFLYVPGTPVRYYRWSAQQLTRSTRYRERVESRRQMFQRFQDIAQARADQTLNRVHWFLLQQNWAVWQPAFTLLPTGLESVTLHLHQSGQTVVLKGREARLAQALLQSPAPRTLEDHARHMVRDLWCEVLNRISQSQPTQLANFALLEATLSQMLGLTHEPTIPTTENKPYLPAVDPVLLPPLFQDVPLFAPLLGEQRLVAQGVLTRWCQQGWLETVAL